jgi:hypothetical protein
MSTTITCPHCHQPLQIDEVLKHQMEASILADAEKKYQQQIEDLKKQTRQEAIDKVRAEYDAKITATKEESTEREKQVREQQEQIKELLVQLRTSKSTQEKLEIEYQKKLLAEESTIKEKAKKEAQEELGMRIAQKDKQLADLEKQLQDAQRKVQQGSQQLQGEVLELELEGTLKSSFPFDDISEVPKGVRGADIIQTVHTRGGQNCGTIIWELKNTKVWSAGWVQKLKEDQRQLKANVAIIVSTVLPESIKSFGVVDGVWVVSFELAVNLADIMRQQLIKIAQVQQAQQGKATKAEIVYDYLVSNEFRQRIEVLVEYFGQKKEELDREKRYFLKKWEKEEKEIFKVLHTTAGMYGDLQGLIGSALPKVASLELPEEIE